MPQTYLVDLDRLISASSLGALIGSRAKLAEAELRVLRERQAALQNEAAAASAALADFRELAERRGSIRDRLLRNALRAALLPERADPTSGLVQNEITAEQRAIADALRGRFETLTETQESLEAVLEAVSAKEAELERLHGRAQLLLNARDPGAAQVAVLRALAEDSAAVSKAIDALMGTAETRTHGSAWTWPLRGVVTQTFGPTSLALVPPARYRGAWFPHFHDGVDVAAPLGSPITAAAAGRVTFAGHLPDGAMVVVIAHDDGLVSMSAHLDDTFRPPPVRKGDRVSAGTVVGFVGLTGLTTGPHLHFAVHDASGPVDPLVILGR